MLLRIQLIQSGKFLVLKTDGTLTIELHTTLFNGSTNFFGSYAYPVEMPLEPNRAALQNAHYISTDSKLRTVDVMMWLEESPYLQLKMSYTLQEEDTVEANCYIDTTLIMQQLTTLKLWQMFPSALSPSTQINCENAAGLQAYMKSTAIAAPGALCRWCFSRSGMKTAYNIPNGAVTMALQTTPYDAATNTPELHNNSGGGIRPIGAQEGWVYKCSVSGAPDLGAGAVVVLAGQYLVFDGDGLWYATENPYGVRVDGYTDLLFPSETVINRWEMDALGNGSFKVDPDGSALCQTQIPFFFIPAMLRRVFCIFWVYGYRPRDE